METEIQQAQKLRGRIWAARSIAITADILQIAIFPLFAEGLLSPLDDGVDLVVAVLITLLVGWHIAFLPSFVIKLVPLADLAPTWTLAVLYVTRSGQAAPSGEILNLLGTAGKQATSSWRPWYDRLIKPRWTPSPATIGVIWTILYPIILFSYGFVFLQVVRGRLPWVVALPFILNLVANVLFTPILFGLNNLWLASADILIVLGTAAWAAIVIWDHYPVIAIVQLPYLLWLAIATILQLSITLWNPGNSRAER